VSSTSSIAPIPALFHRTIEILLISNFLSFYFISQSLHTAYDKNAIRVENLHGEKVGHIKATMAKHLATVMDRQRVIRIQGTIPREGNEYT
jgi:hypothetical protein